MLDECIYYSMSLAQSSAGFFSSHFNAKPPSREPTKGLHGCWQAWSIFNPVSPEDQYVLTVLTLVHWGGTRCKSCICITPWQTTCASVRVHCLRLSWINLCPVNHNKTQMSNFKPSAPADLVDDAEVSLSSKPSLSCSGDTWCSWHLQLTCLSC